MKLFVKYGLWTGIVSGLWGLVSFTAVGWLNRALFDGSIPATDIRSYSGLFSILILVLGIYLAMKQARLRAGGVMTYGQAVKTGALVAVVTGLLVAGFSWLYCGVINPEYANFMVRDTGRALAAAGEDAAGDRSTAGGCPQGVFHRDAGDGSPGRAGGGRRHYFPDPGRVYPFAEVCLNQRTQI